MCPVEDVQLIIFLDYQHHGIDQMQRTIWKHKLERKLFFSLQSISWWESKWSITEKGNYLQRFAKEDSISLI